MGGLEEIRLFCFGHPPNMPFRSTLPICIPNIDFSVGIQSIHSWDFFGFKARCDFGVDLFFEHDPTRTAELNGGARHGYEFLRVGPHLPLCEELNTTCIPSTRPHTASSLLLGILGLGECVSAKGKLLNPFLWVVMNLYGSDLKLGMLSAPSAHFSLPASPSLLSPFLF